MICYVCAWCVWKLKKMETYIPYRGLGKALLTHGLLEHLELSLGHRGRCQRKSKGTGTGKGEQKDEEDGGWAGQGRGCRENTIFVRAKFARARLQSPTIPIVFAHFIGSDAVSEQIYSGARRELVQAHFCTH